MKVILYTAITINGFIAKENDDTSFILETEWESWRLMVKKVGNLIIGRRTYYDVMLPGGQFESIEEIPVIIVSSDPNSKPARENHFIAQSPRAALEIVEQQGSNEALVCGGGTLNASFMSENLVDEIYLDVEPVVFGKGIRLFRENDFEAKLKKEKIVLLCTPPLAEKGSSGVH